MTTFCRLDELGLVVVGQHLQPDRAVLACRVADDAVEEADRWCRRCGCEGRPRDTVTRSLAHEPLGWRPTTLLLTIRRYRCTGCGHVWRQDTSRASGATGEADPHRAAVGAGRAGSSASPASARLAEALAVSWTTANSAVLAEGRRVLLDDPARFDNVQVVGVDEHVWQHRQGDGTVTVVIDLTPVRDRTGPSRLLAMVEGRSQRCSKPGSPGAPGLADGLEVVAMDGFTGFKTATSHELPEATAVLTPSTSSGSPKAAFLDRCRRRVSRTCAATAARSTDPLYRARRTLHTGADLLTDRQQQRLTALFGDGDHIQVQATWEHLAIAAYRHPDRAAGRHAMTRLIIALSAGVPAASPNSAPSAGP